MGEKFGFDFDTPLGELSEGQMTVLLQGAGDEQFDIVYRYKSREVAYNIVIVVYTVM